MNTYTNLMSAEELAHRSALEVFDYEIAKKLHQIAEWRALANVCYANRQRIEAARYQSLIREMDKRVAYLKQRRFEVDEREKQFRESQMDSDWYLD